MMVMSSQEKIKTEVQRLLNDGTKYIFVNGLNGSGKSTAIKELLKSFENTLVFDRSMENDEKYAPFEKAARKSSAPISNSIEKILIENRDKDYSAPQLILNLIDKFKQTKDTKDNYPFFKPNEENYLSQINNKLSRDIAFRFVKEQGLNRSIFFPKKKQYTEIFNEIIKSQTCIFLFEEINTWDNSSLILIKKLIEHGNQAYPLFNNSKIIFTVSVNTNIDKKTELLIGQIQRKCNAVSLEMPRLTKNDFKNFIQDSNVPYESLSDSEQTEIISFLQEYSDDNIEEIPFMIRELYELMKKKNYMYVDRSLFYSALKMKLADIEIPTDQSEEILKYASLMGSTFSENEIKLVTNLNSDEFKTVIDNVLTIKVLKKTMLDQNFKFAFTFFQELFKTKAQKRQNEYYTKLEQIVTKLYPHRYDRRAKYLSNVIDESRKTQNLYLLSLLQEVRNREELDYTIQKNLTEDCSKTLDLFIEAYSYIDKNEYNSALDILNIIKHRASSTPIKAECDILIAFCYSKNVDGNCRKNGVSILNSYIDNKLLKEEYPDIYERLLMRLFIMLVHIGQLDQAEKLYQDLLLRFENCPLKNSDTETKKNILYRMANTLFNPNNSLFHIKEASNYFEKHQSYDKGTINYFISLCNLSAAHIEVGEFHLAFETAQKAEELTLEYKTIKFPRIQILVNNSLLSGYLSKNLDIENCISSLKKIISEMPKNAERIYFISNLSIFYALDNQFDLAYQTLYSESELQQTSNDFEGKYNARAMFNLSVYDYLLGNYKEAISKMEKHLQQQRDCTGPERTSELKRAEKTLAIMKKGTQKYSGEEWLEILLKETVVGSIKNSQINQNSDNYRMLGYMFASLYNWDI